MEINKKKALLFVLTVGLGAWACIFQYSGEPVVAVNEPVVAVNESGFGEGNSFKQEEARKVEWGDRIEINPETLIDGSEEEIEKGECGYRCDEMTDALAYAVETKCGFEFSRNDAKKLLKVEPITALILGIQNITGMPENRSLTTAVANLFLVCKQDGWELKQSLEDEQKDDLRQIISEYQGEYYR